MDYPRPSITEAILDIRVEERDWDLGQLRALGKDLAEFPEIRDISFLSGTMQFSTGPDPSPQTVASSVPIGFQFWSADKKRVWQARKNGFSISHLSPYQGWGGLALEARNLWTVYRAALNPKLTRVAVRYVNRFDIPSQNRIDFADYFRTVPQIPKELDTGLSAFLMQLVLPQAEIQGMVILTQAMIPANLPGTAAIALDIDLFRESDVPQSEEEIWPLFEQMRHRKNRIFEDCITDAARELLR